VRRDLARRFINIPSLVDSPEEETIYPVNRCFWRFARPSSQPSELVVAIDNLNPIFRGASL
jgi:hypothetical protein